jgi:hypothetical protein
MRVLQALAPIVFHDAVQDYLPFGVREQVETWLRSGMGQKAMVLSALDPAPAPVHEGDPAPGGANCMFQCPEWCDECAHQEIKATPDAAQGALFDLPPAKPANAITEGR